MNKICKSCEIEKDQSLFSINYKKGDKYYYRKTCKDCYKNKRKEYHKVYNKKYNENKKIKLI
jgi:capsule polysaccharide modification protein KpsS